MKVAGVTLALASTAFAQLPSLQQVLANTSSLSQLANLAAPFLTNLGAYSVNNSVTLLAPNNQAVSSFLNSSAAAGVSNATIAALLSYHVLPGNYTTIPNASFIHTGLQEGAYANVSNGQVVQAVPNNGSFSLISGLLQNATVNGSAIQFQGGVLHVLNNFLTVPQDIVSTGIALNLTAAVGALNSTKLVGPLARAKDVTYFIPNNAAFQRIGGTLSNLTATNMTAVQQVLEYHVVEGQVLYSTLLSNGSTVQSLQGGNLTARIIGEDVYINNAKVLVPNVLVANGVVHVIDRVLNPNNSTLTPNSSTQDDFASATSASGVPFTSGVPTPSSAVATQSAPNAQGSQKSSSSSAGAWQPVATGALNMGALFGGAALVMNI